MTIVPRWEWRVFGQGFGAAEDYLAALPAGRVQEADELYVLSLDSDASVKVRDGQMDVEHVQDVNDEGLEQWAPVLKTGFPLCAADVSFVLATLGVARPPLHRASYTLQELVDELVGRNPRLLALEVHKRRRHCTVAGCMAELSEVRTDVRSSSTPSARGATWRSRSSPPRRSAASRIWRQFRASPSPRVRSWCSTRAVAARSSPSGEAT